MADVSITHGILRLHLTVPERVLSLHGREVCVAVADIVDVSVVDDALSQVRGMRMPGAGLPGTLAIGTWRGRDRRPFHDFVVIHRPGPGVVITTRGDYARILIGTPEPDALLATVRAALP
jgi:hypothetical protein